MTSKPRVPELPIVAALPRLRAALREGTAAVVAAPPGSGKSTRVPLALLDEPWLAGRRVLMLEPRRLAARALARWMAHLLGEPVGATVGYRTRLDTAVSRDTRVEVLTEGVLTRMLQRDPGLEGVGAVIFDEVHERSLHADLGLALCLDVRASLRPDLRLLAMSATADTERFAALLGGAPILEAAAPAYPVEVRHVARPPGRDLALEAARAVAAVLEDSSGDVLVFLPGAPEIRRAAEALGERLRDRRVEVLPLYGDLPAEAQERAISPCTRGRRKVVLATSIAETSLTIEGVRAVVDAGLARRSRFDPATGMSALVTTRVSRAEAEQRRGRAGRVAAGLCLRLWTEQQHDALRPYPPPEILEADLAPLALELAAWGVADAAALAWPTSPPPAALAQARDLLRLLGAIDAEARITARGREMVRLGMHPRLAHMLLEGRALGCAALACRIAALLEARDVLRAPPAARPVDLRVRLACLAGEQPALPHDVYVDRPALERARRQAQAWRARLDRAASETAGALPEEDELVGRLLAHAYPDRIALRRADGGARYVLSGGRGARLPAGDALAGAELLVVADVDAGAREARIRLAAPLSREALAVAFADRVEEVARIEWDSRAGMVTARRETRLGALVLAERPLERPDPAAVTAALLEGVRAMGLECLPWDGAARQLRARIAFLGRLEPGAWPDVGDTALLGSPAMWLGPWLAGMRRRDDLARLDLSAALGSLLRREQRARLEALAPARVTVPSGARIVLDYTRGEAPVLAARLQELFGMRESPRVAGGRVAVLVEILSPAGRPVQVTRDLAGFWARGYAEVRKELRGRYPKHHWPEDPSTAIATRGTRARG